MLEVVCALLGNMSTNRNQSQISVNLEALVMIDAPVRIDAPVSEEARVRIEAHVQTMTWKRWRKNKDMSTNKNESHIFVNMQVPVRLDARILYRSRKNYALVQYATPRLILSALRVPPPPAVTWLTVYRWIEVLCAELWRDKDSPCTFRTQHLPDNRR